MIDGQPKLHAQQRIIKPKAIIWLIAVTLVAIAIWPRSSARRFSDIVGTQAPSSAKDILTLDQGGMTGGNYYVSATISREDYQQIVTKLKLYHRPDLLEYWPSALRAHNNQWWTVSSINDADTYFGDSEHSTYLVARYENGRIYFKRHVY